MTKRHRWAPFAAQCAVGLIGLTVAARSVDWTELFAVLRCAHVGLVLTAFVLFAAACTLTIARWRVLLGVVAKPPSWRSLARLTWVGIFFNTFVPGGLAGDVVRAYRLDSGMHGRAQTFASIFTDRFIGLCGLCLFALLGAAQIFDELTAVGLRNIFLAITVLLAGAGIVFYSRRMGHGIMSTMDRLGLSADRARRVLGAVRNYRAHPGRVAAAFGITFLSHALFITGLTLVARSLGIRLPLAHFIAFLPVIALLSAAPVSVNGLGVREAAYLLLFTRVGVVPEQALGLSFLHFGLVLMLGLAGGAVFLGELLHEGSRRMDRTGASS